MATKAELEAELEVLREIVAKRSIPSAVRKSLTGRTVATLDMDERGALLFTVVRNGTTVNRFDLGAEEGLGRNKRLEKVGNVVNVYETTVASDEPVEVVEIR